MNWKCDLKIKSIDEDYVEDFFNELTIIKDDIETLSEKKFFNNLKIYKIKKFQKVKK